MTLDRSTHGILNPRLGFEHFHLDRLAPSPALSPFVDRYWIVRWDLRGREPYLSETLPHPSVHLSFGEGRAEVHGVGTKRFEKRLVGASRAFGVKFTPAGFRAFAKGAVAELTDRTVSVEEGFGVAEGTLARDMLEAEDDAVAKGHVEAFLAARGPKEDASMKLVNGLVETARSERSLLRVEDLAVRAKMSPRALQRLFREYVGVGPKWVVRRMRIHDAAERSREGAVPDWAALAQELGYFDHAHFSRDFKAHIGRTPTEYAKLCRKSGP